MKQSNGIWKISNERQPKRGGKLSRKDLERYAHLSDEKLAQASGLPLRTIKRMRAA